MRPFFLLPRDHLKILVNPVLAVLYMYNVARLPDDEAPAVLLYAVAVEQRGGFLGCGFLLARASAFGHGVSFHAAG